MLLTYCCMGLFFGLERGASYLKDLASICHLVLLSHIFEVDWHSVAAENSDLSGHLIYKFSAVNLAVSLANKLGLKVGLLDADVFGPSIPRMMKLQGRPAIGPGQYFFIRQTRCRIILTSTTLCHKTHEVGTEARMGVLCTEQLTWGFSTLCQRLNWESRDNNALFPNICTCCIVLMIMGHLIEKVIESRHVIWQASLELTQHKVRPLIACSHKNMLVLLFLANLRCMLLDTSSNFQILCRQQDATSREFQSAVYVHGIPYGRKLLSHFCASPILIWASVHLNDLPDLVHREFSMSYFYWSHSEADLLAPLIMNASVLETERM